MTYEVITLQGTVIVVEEVELELVDENAYDPYNTADDTREAA